MRRRLVTYFAMVMINLVLVSHGSGTRPPYHNPCFPVPIVRTYDDPMVCFLPSSNKSDFAFIMTISIG
jgi:hypothetical protein